MLPLGILSFRQIKKISKKPAYDYIIVVAAGIRWRSQRLKDLSDRRISLEAKFDRKQACLVKQAVSVARSFVPLIEMSIAVLAELDVLCRHVCFSLRRARIHTCCDKFVKLKDLL